MPIIISEKNIEGICRKLAKTDKRLAVVYNKYGSPPVWDREPTFTTLVHIILEQQVSLASALAAFNKLKEQVGEISPENILALTDEEMRAVYFSRQKMVYARELSGAVLDRRLRLDELHGLSDSEVRRRLMKIKGIGIWTSDIFLLMALLRPDVMPKGDLALHSAWKRLADLNRLPSSDEFIEAAERWKPYRSVAARLLWHFYLSEREK